MLHASVSSLGVAQTYIIKKSFIRASVLKKPKATSIAFSIEYYMYNVDTANPLFVVPVHSYLVLLTITYGEDK